MLHGRDYGIRRLGGRTKMVNHVEACFPTPSVDYVPALFGEAEKEFAAAYFSANAQANYRHTDGSYEYADISELYRTPIELGWKKSVKFDHDFIGCAALEPEVASPKRTMVTLVWNADDVADVYASLFRKDTPYQYMEMPRKYPWLRLRRRSHQGREVGGRVDVTLLQLLLPADAFALRSRCRTERTGHRGHRGLGPPQRAAKADPRDRGNRAVQERQPARGREPPITAGCLALGSSRRRRRAYPSCSGRRWGRRYHRYRNGTAGR